jgi:phospholipid transport system substrate-binding protein
MRFVRFFAVLLLAGFGAAPAFAETAAAGVSPVPAAAPAAPAASASASDVVKNFYAQLTATMKQGDQLGFTGRYKKLKPVLRRAFNLPLMARFSVGLVWDKATPAEQEQITDAFSAFSIATYANRFAAYDGEQFKVDGEKPASGGMIVATTLTPKNGDAVALNYLMRKDETGAWRIVDVFMNGTISELATRRAEFSAVIERDGIGALVNALDEKSKPMGPS